MFCMYSNVYCCFYIHICEKSKVSVYTYTFEQTSNNTKAAEEVIEIRDLRISDVHQNHISGLRKRLLISSIHGTEYRV